jgi:hypothetical protein
MNGQTEPDALSSEDCGNGRLANACIVSASTGYLTRARNIKEGPDGPDGAPSMHSSPRTRHPCQWVFG